MSDPRVGRILVVDDEACIRSLLKCALAGAGLDVFEADCAEAALQVAAEHGPFVLVVSDVIMPGVDGFELARRLRRRGQAEAFLFVSGYCADDSMNEQIDAIGSAEFLSKPFAIQDLLRAARAMLSRPPVREASVRDHRARHALRRTRSPNDPAKRLCRRSNRLHKESHDIATLAAKAACLSQMVRVQVERQRASMSELGATLDRQRYRAASRGWR